MSQQVADRKEVVDYGVRYLIGREEKLKSQFEASLLSALQEERGFFQLAILTRQILFSRPLYYQNQINETNSKEVIGIEDNLNGIVTSFNLPNEVVEAKSFYSGKVRLFLRKLVEPDPVKWYSTEISYLIHLKIKGVFDPIEHAISALEAYEKQKLDDFNKEVIKKFGSQAEMQHLFISFLSHISSTVEWRKWAKESAYLFLREYSPEELKRTVLIARHNTSNLYDLYDSSIDEPIVEEEQSPDMRFLERLRIFKDKIQRHSNRASREVKGRVKNLITSIEQGEKEAKRNMDIKVI